MTLIFSMLAAICAGVTMLVVMFTRRTDEHIGAVPVVVVLMAVLVLSVFAAAGAADEGRRRDARIERALQVGAARYNQRSGELEWADAQLRYVMIGGLTPPGMDTIYDE